MESRLEAMSHIMEQGEMATAKGRTPSLDPEVERLAEAKRWTLDDPPVEAVDPLR